MHCEKSQAAAIVKAELQQQKQAEKAAKAEEKEDSACRVTNYLQYAVCHNTARWPPRIKLVMHNVPKCGAVATAPKSSRSVILRGRTCLPSQQYMSGSFL